MYNDIMDMSGIYIHINSQKERNKGIRCRRGKRRIVSTEVYVTCLNTVSWGLKIVFKGFRRRVRCNLHFSFNSAITAMRLNHAGDLVLQYEHPFTLAGLADMDVNLISEGSLTDDASSESKADTRCMNCVS